MLTLGWSDGVSFRPLAFFFEFKNREKSVPEHRFEYRQTNSWFLPLICFFNTIVVAKFGSLLALLLQLLSEKNQFFSKKQNLLTHRIILINDQLTQLTFIAECF